MIISGYQGIGKSSLAGKNNCIDLESGNFWVDGKRADDWYKPYCQIANHLSEQGYTVFVSSHEPVRRELEKSKEPVYVIFPAIDLKDEWIKKLEDRYNNTKLDKDRIAFKQFLSDFISNDYASIKPKDLFFLFPSPDAVPRLSSMQKMEDTKMYGG